MMKFKLAWRNVWRNKKRSIITMAMIALAVFLSVVMRSMQIGTYNQMIDGFVKYNSGYVRISQNGYHKDKDINLAFPVSQINLESIKANKNVLEISPRVESFLYSNFKTKGQAVRLIGIDPKLENKVLELEENLAEGEMIMNEDEQVLLGNGLAKKFGMRTGDSLIVQGQGYRGQLAIGKYRVKGILKINNPAISEILVYLPIKEARSLFDLNDSMATSISVALTHPSKMESAQKYIQSHEDTSHFEVMNWKEMSPELQQMIQGDSAGGLIMIFILYVLIAFGILGTIIMMTAERQYEFGVMISIGMKRLALSLIIIIETVFIGILGTACGVLFAFPLVYYVYLNPIQYTGQAAETMVDMGFEPAMFTTLDFNLALWQAIIVFSILLILNLYPMIKLMFLKPVEAMRK